MHTKDRWLGKPFRLLPWEKLLILALFTIDPATRLRMFRWAFVEIGKKNGKTELAAALALFFAFGPSGPDGKVEPDALVVCAAGSDDQADLVFGAAKIMAEQSPTLKQILETFESEILCPSLVGSKVVRVAAAAKKQSSTLDGKNIYVVICDELHCWEGPQGRTLWEVLTNAQVTRRQPLVFQITTAGFDQDTVCGEQYNYAKAVVAGEVDDAHYLVFVIEPPKDANHRDPAVIEAANPSFGYIVQIEFYLDQLSKKTEAVFRRYFLNMWTEGEDSWLGQGTWERLSIGEFEFAGKTIDMFTGTDSATKHDSTAHVRAQWHVCKPGCPGWSEQDAEATADMAKPTRRKLRLQAKIWARPFDPRTKRPLESWRLPIVDVENELRTYHRRHRLRACGYDPALFERSAQQLETEGLPMEEVPQSDARMVPASMLLFQFIVDGLIEHDGDLAFTQHMHNAVAVQTRGGNGGWRLSKGKTKKKMDAAIAAAIAVYMAMNPPEAEDDAELEPVLVMT